MKIPISSITKLRQTTGAGVIDCKKALEQAKGDLKKAKEILKKRSVVLAEKKKDRKTSVGRIESYTHLDGKIGSLVKLTCETDFVARNKDFKKLAHELCLQVAAMKPKTGEKLLQQDYIRDPSKKVKDLVKEAIAKLGENIKVKGFERMEV